MSEKKAFPLRLSPDLYDEVRRWAEADLRSVNAQIEFLLRRAVAHRRAGGAAPTGPDTGAGPARDAGDDA
ncbi:MAG: hypothetical protein IPK64_13265 [bacterium]|nr:hypothetical protein [bacterium]